MKLPTILLQKGTSAAVVPLRKGRGSNAPVSRNAPLSGVPE